MRWPFRRRADPVATPTPRVDPPAPARMNPRTLSIAADGWTGAPAITTRQQIFAPAKPAPGVVPDGIAMDAAPGDITGWAAAGQYGEGISFVGYAYLAELAQRPEYRRISETIAKEMTRKWVKLVSTGDDDKSDHIKALTDAMDRYRLQDVFRRVAEHDGFFGRGHIFVDVGARSDAELRVPLFVDRAKVAEGALKGFRTVEPIWTYPNGYNSSNPLSPDFYRPSSWFVQGLEVHQSRLLTFVGREVPDLLKPSYAFGGLSLSQMAMPYVNNWLRTRQSVSDLLHSFTVWKLATNMASVLQGDAADGLVARAQMFNQMRDNRGLMLTDKDTEELSNISAPLSSLDALQAQSQEQMAAVSGIPLVKLLGITPSGLNASSDGEIRSFYDWVHAQQEHLFRHHLKTCLDIIQLSEFGEIDDEITFEFEPLWQLDEAALAAVEKTKADTHAVYLDGGVVAPDEVRASLANDEASPYHGLDMDSPAPGVSEDIPEANEREDVTPKDDAGG